MRPRKHWRIRWAVMAGGVLALSAWFLPSYFSAERYRRRLESGLEALLHRPTRFGAASFRLLPRPGFTLENTVIREDPAFGSEPFARIDRVECDLRWRSLWRRRLEFSRLHLERPSFNIVRNAQGEWNVETLLAMSGVTGAASSSGAAPGPSAFDIETDDGRLNFKSGDSKKPLAILDLRARMNLDPAHRRIRFQLTGNPTRTDLPHPPPGRLELEGEWRSGNSSGGAVVAALRTRGALLYNWVPLVSGNNPELYGVIDADVRLGGTMRVIKVEGEGSLAQLHRWQLLPPADPMPFRVRFRGEFDRDRKRALVESMDASFANSHLHVAGAVENIPQSPELDLVVALERSRLEDLGAVARRLWSHPASIELAGRVDGQLTVQGPWSARRFGGFIGAREVRLTTSSGSFPVSEIAVRVDPAGVRLDPVSVSVSPRHALTVEGAVYRPEGLAKVRRKESPPHYEVKVAAKSIELAEVVRFARGLGVSAVENIDAQGVGNATAVLAGAAWPLSRTQLTVKGDVRAARLLVPGLTEPVQIPRARLSWSDDRLTVDTLTAVIGTSVVTGRVERQGAKTNPWIFDLKADRLSVELGAALFDSLGHRPPLPFLARLPGLGSSAARRSVASGLFSALNARGRFQTPVLTYRSLTLQDFRTSVNLSGRILQLSDASFRAGGGRAQGQARVDLRDSPARVSGDVAVAGLRLESLASRFPAVLREVRGGLSGKVQFETRGLSRSEMAANLQATGRARLERVTLGEFDPLQAIARRTAWGILEPSQHEVIFRPAEISFEIGDRKVSVVNQRVEVEGARLVLSGGWAFDGPLDLDVSADLRDITRRWMTLGAQHAASPRSGMLHLAGPFDRIVAQAGGSAAQASRWKL